MWDALEAKDYALAERIIADDPDQLEGVDWVPPSLHACIYGDLPEMFEWFLDHGANIEQREQDYGEHTADHRCRPSPQEDHPDSGRTRRRYVARHAHCGVWLGR